MEKTFYDDSEICVTSTRLIMPGKTVPLDEIIAVDHTIDEPRKIGLPAGILATSLLGLFVTYLRAESSGSWIFLGGALVAALWMAMNRERYTVSVVQSRERVAILVSQNQQFAYAVLGALREALSYRQQRHG